ncbi:OprD family outer membrane porin [Sulfuricurvum sp.]|uniref:OprD family outer membrane porin n=1 Tax=Sulfuricurvum sp. TaxID=2025608 RepID=UPI002E345CEB|nr:OprD family outer membrane porin [Sulfuricurvum sp.]HEX5330254.1 OprD family outer membrane porin [Sulfuricurvum sp.]
MKKSIIAASVLSTLVSVQAADDLASAFKEGKLDGRLRAHYFATDWDDNTATGKNAPDAHGLAVGGSLIYKTAPLRGVSGAVGLYTTQNPGGWTEKNDGVSANTSKDLFSRGPGATYNYGTGYAVLAQAYLQYDIAKTKLKAGRMLMSNPWINPNDTKMIPIAIEGYELVSNDIADTTIQIDYADKIKERGMNYFGSMADTGDTPDKIAAYYATHYGTTTGIHGDAPDVLSVGIKNKSIENLEFQAWGMHWANIVDQAMLEANYKLKAGDATIGFGGRYIAQRDKGAGAIIAPLSNNHDSDNSIDTSLFALRTSVGYGAAKLTLATARTASGADLIAPWRGFPTEGYTRSMTQTDWNANTRSYKAQLDYDFNQWVSGLSTVLGYAYYDRDPSKTPYQSMTDRAYGNGNTHQANLDIMYKLAGSWKGTELKLRLMDQDNDLDGTKANGTSIVETSNRELRAEVNYLF